MTEIIIALIGGGGIAGIIAAIFKVTQTANNKAISTLEKAWKEDKKESNSFREKMLGIISDTNTKVGELQEEVGNLKVEIATWACYKGGCKLRKKDEGTIKKDSKKA